MTKGKASFIVPCFNSEASLRLCLESISNQKHSDAGIEIIVVDNGSEDTSVSIAESFSALVIVDSDASISGLRNLGAERATGSLFVFVDSDCILHEHWLQIAEKALEDPEVGMVGCRTHLLPEDSGWVEKTWKIHLDLGATSGEPGWLVTRALAVKREIFTLVSGFDETLSTCEDVAFGHKIARVSRLVDVPQLAPVHLEDADDLRTFFKKEVWRGSDSIKTSAEFLRSSRNSIALLKELISLSLPFYFALFSLLLILSGVFAWAKLLCISLLAIVMPIALLTLKATWNSAKLSAFPALFCLYFLYIYARVCAMPVELWKKLSS